MWSTKRIIKIVALVVSLGVAIYIGVIIVGVSSLASLGGKTIPSPPYPGYDSLIEAISSGNPAKVKAVLDRGIDPNVFPNDSASVANEYDLAPLCAAAADGNIAIITLLLDHHADPNIGDGWDGSPLCAVAGHGKMDALKILITRGANVNNPDGTSPALWSAATSGQDTAVSLLLSKGAKPGEIARGRKSTPETLLSVVRSEGRPQIATLLVKAGAK